MLIPFLAFFEKFKYLTTATLTPKRNTVQGGRAHYPHPVKEFCSKGRGLSAETASHSSITNFLITIYILVFCFENCSDLHTMRKQSI